MCEAAARHRDGSKTHSRRLLSTFCSSSQDNFLLQLGHKKVVAAVVGGPEEGPPHTHPTPSTSQKYAFVPLAISGPHTTQLTGRAHMKQTHWEFEPFHYFFILKLRASHIKSIKCNTKETTTLWGKKTHRCGVCLFHHNIADSFLLSAARAEPVNEDTAATVQAACVAAGAGGPPTAIIPHSPQLLPTPVPRCCNLLQLFHKSLVSYH